MRTPDVPAPEPGRWWNRTAIAVLPVVAAVGAVLSWGSLYEAAARTLGPHAPTPAVFGHPVNLAGAAFPLLVDALILGASARYVAGVKGTRPVGGWRAAAHSGVVGTVLLNAAAAPRLVDIPWHITAPIVWSVLVELVARDVLGELHETAPATPAGRIPARLWVTAPAESIRVSWRMARTGHADVDTVRGSTERCAAARDHLTAAHPDRRAWRMRRQITRRLWAGALDPATLAHLIDTHPDPTDLHRAVLRVVATHDEPAMPAGRVHVVRAVRAGVDRPAPVVAARESGPRRVEAQVPVPAAAGPEPSRGPSAPIAAAVGASPPGPDPDPGPSARAAADLRSVVQAVADGQILGRVTKAKVREHLHCSNPHAGTVNALYQQHNRSAATDPS